jgi:hypothetical protein
MEGLASVRARVIKDSKPLALLRLALLPFASGCGMLASSIPRSDTST